MLNDKPGVIGTIGNLGQAVAKSVKQEVVKNVENSAEQLGIKEKKEGSPSTPDAATVQAKEAMQKQQSQETVNWLYGITPAETPTPALPEKKEEKIADIKAQLGLEQKQGNTANTVEQIGIKNPFTGSGHEIANPIEQIGLAQDTKPTASLSDQLNFTPKPVLTPDEQAKKQRDQNRLHLDYYQKINQDYHQKLKNPTLQSDTEERQKEASEEQETAAQRMERQMQEDLAKKQQEEEKKKKIDPSVDMTHNMEKNRGSMG